MIKTTQKNDMKTAAASGKLEAPIVLNPDQIAMIAAAGAGSFGEGSTIRAGGMPVSPIKISA